MIAKELMKILFLFTPLLVTTSAVAVDVAPRISDREIIESLAELKAGQKALEEKMDLRFNVVDQRFDAVGQRFDAVGQRFDDVDQRFKSVGQRFTTVDQRFDTIQEQIDQRFQAVDQRLDFIQQLMLVTIAGIFGLIGFIMWDRYSTLRPMDTRLRTLEEELERDLELQSPEGSRLTRLIHALRELAKEDKKVAAILRSFSLL